MLKMNKKIKFKKGDKECMKHEAMEKALEKMKNKKK